MSRQRVVVTGAAGLVGGILCERLAERFDVVAVDRVRAAGVERANLERLSARSSLFAGADAVVDLAARSDAAIGWDDARRNMRITENVLEACRANGVRRYVFASSNHVSGLAERDEPYASIVAGRYDGLRPGAFELLSPLAPPRPDGPYGVSKLFGEGAARLYSERHGVSALCLRIGTVNRDDAPRTPRHFATLLTHADLHRLVERSLEAPDTLRFGVYYGVSGNTWRFWSLDEARADLGYEPGDDAERFRP